MTIDGSIWRRVCLVVLCLTLNGCASYWAERRADQLVTKGQSAEAVPILEELANKEPSRYRVKYISTRDAITRDLIQKAQAARRQRQQDLAHAYFQQVLKYDPLHADARQGIELIARDRREADLFSLAHTAREEGKNEVARYHVNEILVANPDNTEAQQLRKDMDIEQNRLEIKEPGLVQALNKPVSLEFRNASLQAILEVLSQSSGLNFIFDRDVKTDLRTTIFARNTTVKDALSLILRSSQLATKTLNETTLLIYSSTPEKEKQYEDLVVRSFYLGSADPKKTQELIRSIVPPKSMYVDDKLRILVIRDSLSVIETIERLLAAYDLAPPEVVLEVEIFEVSRDSLLNVGVQFPDSVSASVYGSAGKPGSLTIGEAENLNRNNFRLLFPDPLAVLNLRQTSGKANTLANPRIRVKSLEKAKVMIGDKVPVITTTTNQTSSSTTESVSYLDVGLKLEVEPEIHANNEVSINIALEVSNIIKEIKSTTGLLTYQIGTRSANTVLRLRDGETQALAGLIKDEQRDSASHLPGLGKIPLLGRLFSNETNNSTKSEIVLLITPRVVRSRAAPDAHVVEFMSGTSAKPSTSAFRLEEAGRYSNSGKNLKDAPVRPASPEVPVAPKPTSVPATSRDAVPSLLPALPDAEQASVQQLRLDFAAPSKVQEGQGFSVPLLIDGQPFDELQFDFVIDSDEIKLVHASPIANMKGMEAAQGPNGIHVRIEGAEAHKGPLMVLALQAGKKQKLPVTIGLKNLLVRRVEVGDETVSGAAERKLQIVP